MIPITFQGIFKPFYIHTLYTVFPSHTHYHAMVLVMNTHTTLVVQSCVIYSMQNGKNPIKYSITSAAVPNVASLK